jgi:hypothetical protein
VQAQKHAQTKLDTSSNIGRDKSFVDDLNKELGIVRMRVALVPRSAEIQPTFWRFVTFTLLTNSKISIMKIKKLKKINHSFDLFGFVLFFFALIGGLCVD